MKRVLTLFLSLLLSAGALFAQDWFQSLRQKANQGDAGAKNLLNSLVSKAQQGNDASQFFLGMAFDKGDEDFPRDFTEALKWYRLAAEQGNPEYQWFLGSILLSRGEKEVDDLPYTLEALKWLRISADKGFLKSQILLSVTLRNDLRVIDVFESAKWRGKAAYQGDAGMQYLQGLSYLLGTKGVPRDDVLAYMWFSLSTASGYKGTDHLIDLEVRMTPQQIAQAQELARNWKPKK